MYFFLWNIILLIKTRASLSISQPTGLMVEWKLHPHIGVDSPKPHLGWVVPHIYCGNSEKQLNQYQEKYQVHIFKHNKLLSDSFEVHSSRSSRVPWSGPPLEPHTTYFWRVRVWTSAGCVSEWSDRGKIVTSLFQVGFAKTTKPIWSDSGAKYVYLRKVASKPANLISAVVFITAAQDVEREKLLGAYRLYINESPIGTGPGRGNTAVSASNHTQYDTYDVTDLVCADHKEAIIIAIQGYHHSGDDNAKIIMELHLQSKNGSTKIIGTNSTWSAFNANKVFNPTSTAGGAYQGPREYIDARNDQINWRTHEFPDPPPYEWTNASEHSVFPTLLKAKLALPINITIVEPVTIIQTDVQHWFFDFGSEIMAGLQLTWPNGEDGQQLDLRMSEELTTPTSIMYPMRTGNKYQMTWTVKKDTSVFEQHEYFLFRYGELKMTGYPETCISVNENEQCDFQCPINHIISSINFSSYGTPIGYCRRNESNTFRINASCHANDSIEIVQSLCIGKNSCSFNASNVFFGKESCSHAPKKFSGAVRCTESPANTSIYPRKMNAEDVPFSLSAWVVHYPWVDDDSSFDSSDNTLNSVWDLCQNTLKVTSLDTFTDSNTRERLPYEADGFITGSSRYVLQREFMLPRHSAHHNLLNPTWPTEWRQTIPLMAYADYMNTGDLELMNNYYDIMQESTQKNCIDPDSNLVNYTNCSHQPNVKDIVDWPKGSRDGYQMTNVNTVINAYLVGSLTALAKMANVSGRSWAARVYFEEVESTKLAMKNILINNDTNLFVDGYNCSHSAFHAQIFPIFFGVTQNKEMLEFLKTKRMTGSVYSAYAFLLALYNMDFDHGAFALDILTSCDKNSWCNMIKQGATATMEAWTTDEKPNLSWSHPWATAPTFAIASGLMGITPISPGFKLFQVKPQPGNLKWASIKRPTLSGYILMNFNQTDLSFKLSISPPAGTLAKICLPLLGIAGSDLNVDGKIVKGIVEGDYVCINGIGSSNYPRVIIRGDKI